MLLQLRRLDLPGYVKELPAGLAGCAQLSRLDLSSCRLEEWPAVLQQLRGLVELLAAHSGLGGRAPDGAFEGLEGLTLLVLSGNREALESR